MFGGPGSDYLGDREPDGSCCGGIAWPRGSDRLFGGAGTDSMSGARGPSLLRGGAGGDIMCGYKHADRFNGMAGHDRAFNTPSDKTDTFISIEKRDTFCLFF